MTEEINRELLCKDCVHGHATWFDRLTKSAWGFKCHHPLSWVPEEFSPVTGVTKPGYWNGCGSMRVMKCGPGAKHWEPRDTKRDLFLRVKHGR